MVEIDAAIGEDLLSFVIIWENSSRADLLHALSLSSAANDEEDDEDDNASIQAGTPVVRSPEEISFDLLRLTVALRVGEEEEETTGDKDEAGCAAPPLISSFSSYSSSNDAEESAPYKASKSAVENDAALRRPCLRAFKASSRVSPGRGRWACAGQANA